jgi:hypothetical protein
MVQLEAGRYHTAEALVVDAMSVLHPPALSQITIPTGRDIALPEPTTGRLVDDIIHRG